jgi:hypothetical protein
VPYHVQENGYYCGAAVVQMLAEWSGAFFTQDQLFTAMNGTIGSGISVDNLLQGIRTFTALGDAVQDVAQYTDNTYFARQIASVSNKYPVACTTDGNTHSVVLYGGAWHSVSDSSNHLTYYWDTVYFHDPGRGAGLQWTAGAWQNLNCSTYGSYCVQLISQSAAAEGPRTLADYNPTVYVNGADDGGGQFYLY